MESLPFKCGECKKGFSQAYRLKAHLLTHSEERPFTCPKCKKGFKSNPALKQHMEKENKRNFPCETCGVAFRTQTSFEKHQILHTFGEPPYQCHECNDKRFILLSKFKRHLKIHQKPQEQETEASLTPAELEATTSTPSKEKELEQPDAADNGENSFACWICSALFTKTDDLERHFINFHSVLPSLAKATVSHLVAEYENWKALQQSSLDEKVSQSNGRNVPTFIVAPVFINIPEGISVEHIIPT